MKTIGSQSPHELAANTCSQLAMICTIADTRPIILLPWDDVSRMQSDTDIRPHKGDQPRLKAGQPYFPQDLLRSTAPDHLPVLYTRPTNTRSSSTRTRQGRTMPPWNGLIIQALFLIAFFEDKDHASRTERCREGSPLRACQLCRTLFFKDLMTIWTRIRTATFMAAGWRPGSQQYTLSVHLHNLATQPILT